MSKTLIFSAPQGDAPDMKLTIDSTGRNFVIDLGDGDLTEAEVPEGTENQLADLFQALADQASTLVPGRPSSFVRTSNLVASNLAAKVGEPWEPHVILGTLDEGVGKLKTAFEAGDEESVLQNLTGLVAALSIVDHKLGTRVFERLEKL